MCSNLDNIDIPVKASEVKIDQLQFCKKCQGKPFVVLQRKDVFCRDCFYEYCSHKFRSTIGKSRKVKPGDKVLIAFSGGPSSTAMLDMIEDGLNKPNDHKKLMFCPSILFIRELNYIGDDDSSKVKELKIIERLKKSNCPSFISSLEMFYSDKQLVVDLKEYSDIDNNGLLNHPQALSTLTDNLKSISSLTGKEDYLRIIRQQLMQRIAAQENMKYIFVGQTCTRTAIQMLTDLAQGKASQITSEHSFVDDRFSVSTLKPMREFTKKEVTFWNIMRNNQPVEWFNLSTKQDNKSCLTKLTEYYIQGLEVDFPATVYTIFKTGNKLKRPEQNGTRCSLCQSSIDLEDICSASHALKLSNKLSKNLPATGLNEIQRNKEMKLCYSCGNLLVEMGKEPQNLDISQYLL